MSTLSLSTSPPPPLTHTNIYFQSNIRRFSRDGPTPKLHNKTHLTLVSHQVMGENILTQTESFFQSSRQLSDIRAVDVAIISMTNVTILEMWCHIKELKFLSSSRKKCTDLENLIIFCKSFHFVKV